LNVIHPPQAERDRDALVRTALQAPPAVSFGRPAQQELIRGRASVAVRSQAEPGTERAAVSDPFSLRRCRRMEPVDVPLKASVCCFAETWILRIALRFCVAREL